MKILRYHVVISGRVQGVGFRHNTKLKAVSLGITGWVMNRKDGGVEVVAEGYAEPMTQFLEFLEQGPPSARVDNIDSVSEEPTGEFDAFNVSFVGY